jgi:hypothetical protein
VKTATVSVKDLMSELPEATTPKSTGALIPDPTNYDEWEAENGGFLPMPGSKQNRK